MKAAEFWVLISCSLVDLYHDFNGVYFFNLQSSISILMMYEVHSSETLRQSSRPQSVTSKVQQYMYSSLWEPKFLHLRWKHRSECLAVTVHRRIKLKQLWHNACQYIIQNMHFVITPLMTCVCVCVCMYIYIYIYIYIYTHVYIYIYIYIYMHSYTFRHRRAETCKSLYMS